MPARFQTSDMVDFLVIGSGAAGGSVAKELSEAGFRAVVLEQGPYLRERDFTHDEVKFDRGRFLMNDPRRQPQTFRKSAAETARRELGVGYGRQVGGGTVHFNANYCLAGANPFEAPRSKPYPLPPMPVKSSGILFERGARKLGLHPFPAPVAILSQNYKGRPGCQHCGYCPRFGCEFGSKSSSLASVIRMAERTKRCEVRSDSYVARIETNGQGRVTGALYFDSKKKMHLQKAKAVVLCANGAETPRLLLLSESNRFPRGLANSSGLVGKYLMCDTYTFATGLFDRPLNEYKSIDVTRVVFDYYAADPKRGFYGGGGIDSRFGINPIAHAIRGLPPDLPQWGVEWKKLVGEYFTHTMSSLTHLTSLPLATNTIDLDPELKDDWGLPAMRVTFKMHADDLANMKFILARQREILEAAGAKRVWDAGVGDLMGSVHLMGTCRMGNDPTASVVDKFNRAHDLPNLFIVDGSSFVTSGRQQPTATIQALAYRAADHMIAAAKKGEI